MEGEPECIPLASKGCNGPERVKILDPVFENSKARRREGISREGRREKMWNGT